MQPLNTLDGLFFPGLEADGILTAVGMPLSKSDDKWRELLRLEDDFVGKDLVILIGACPRTWPIVSAAGKSETSCTYTTG